MRRIVGRIGKGGAVVGVDEEAPDFEPWPDALLVVSTTRTYTPDAVYPAHRVKVRTEADGSFAVAVFPNESGDEGSTTSVRLPDGSSYTRTVPAGETDIELAALIALGITEVDPQYATILTIMEDNFDAAIAGPLADTAAAELAATTAAAAANAAATQAEADVAAAIAAAEADIEAAVLLADAATDAATAATAASVAQTTLAETATDAASDATAYAIAAGDAARFDVPITYYSDLPADPLVGERYFVHIKQRPHWWGGTQYVDWTGEPLDLNDLPISLGALTHSRASTATYMQEV